MAWGAFWALRPPQGQAPALRLPACPPERPLGPPLPGLKKVVQGLGQRRGACPEFSPGSPFMCRKVEMRLACTATRLPPTPGGTHRVRQGLSLPHHGALPSVSQRPSQQCDSTGQDGPFQEDLRALLSSPSRAVCAHPKVLPRWSADPVSARPGSRHSGAVCQPCLLCQALPSALPIQLRSSRAALESDTTLASDRDPFLAVPRVVTRVTRDHCPGPRGSLAAHSPPLCGQTLHPGPRVSPSSQGPRPHR